MAALPNVAAAAQWKHRDRKHAAVAPSCTTTPVKSPQVIPSSLTIDPTKSAQFVICTQYSTVYKLTVNPPGFVTVPASVTPTVQPNSIKAAMVTVTAGATGCQDGTITVSDKKTKSVTVNVHVTGCTQTFTFAAPGGAQNFTVPPGVTQITVDAVGASGGKACNGGTYSNAGGSGFELKATGIAVTPGQALYVYVGGSPVANSTTYCSFGVPSYAGAGFNGGGTGVAVEYTSSGGGGGASDVRTNADALTTSNDSRLIIAGGGGGGAVGGKNTTGGNGGYPNGAVGGYFFVGTDPTSALAGQGGTQDASGGEGGQVPNFPNIYGSCSGNQGTLGSGGATSNPTNCTANAGGGTTGAGGGGYYGGGSGAAYDIASSDDSGVGNGGGGSSFVQKGATVVVQQVATSGQCDANNNGCITISY
jgi:hypothetical protein